MTRYAVHRWELSVYKFLNKRIYLNKVKYHRIEDFI